jgi:hypothetical protein
MKGTALVLLTVWAPAVGLAVQRPIFRGGTDAVVVDVSVLRSGRPVRGLRADSFVVLDNGAPQPVAEATLESVSMNVVLLADVSASLDGSIRFRSTRREAVNRAVAEMRTLTESDDVIEVVGFAAGTSRPERLESMSPAWHARTSVFDGILSVVLRPPIPGRRSVLVVLTDGLDTASVVPAKLRDAVLQRSAAVVHVLCLWPQRGVPGAFGPFVSPGASAEYLRPLRELAIGTGGTWHEVRNAQGLSRALRELLQATRLRYVLRYIPTDSRPGWHELSVTVPQGGYDIRHRPGYWRD